MVLPHPTGMRCLIAAHLPSSKDAPQDIRGALRGVVLQKAGEVISPEARVSVQPLCVSRSNPFKWRHYQPEIILLCVRAFLDLPPQLSASSGNGE